MNDVPVDLIHILCEYLSNASQFSKVNKYTRVIALRHSFARSGVTLGNHLGITSDNIDAYRDNMISRYDARLFSKYLQSIADTCLYDWCDTSSENSRRFRSSGKMCGERRRICVQGTISSKFTIWPYRMPLGRVIRIKHKHPLVYALL